MMKKFIVFLILLLFGCSNNEKSKQTQNTFVGNWKLIEILMSDGASQNWTTVADGYTIEIKSNGSFTSSKFAESCIGGTYTVVESKLILNYNCSFEYAKLESTEDSTSNQLIVSNPLCDEPCLEKFIKL